MPFRAILLSGLAACTALLAAQPAQADSECGGASWYAIRNTTASGEMMDPNAMTAAHRTLPFGTIVKVINQSNGRELTLRINDRGPFIGGRIIDVSREAASQLGFRNAGHAPVCLQIVS